MITTRVPASRTRTGTAERREATTRKMAGYTR